MTDFAISDTHFFHKKIIEYCKRPFSSAEEMNETIITNWNAVVKPEDTVWHCGDVGWFKNINMALDILKRLNGHLKLIRGNHDHDDCIPRKPPFGWGFESISDVREIKYKGYTFYMFHYPIAVWKDSHRGSIHLHGHLHDIPVPLTGESLRRMDVGVDSTGFRPISLDEIISRMRDIPEQKIWDKLPGAKK